MAFVCEERVNLRRINYLLDELSFQKYFSYCDYNEKDARKEYNKLQTYLLHKIKTNVYAKYNYVKKRKDGRLYGDKTSIQNIPRFIRHFICEGDTTDIDMRNAHPKILYQLCKKYDYDCECLEKYINNREEILEKIQTKTNKTREEAKKLILTAVNTNKNVNCREYSFVDNFSNEMKKIQKEFELNKDFEYVKQYAKKDNFEGSFINHILCICEENILKVMRDYCEKYNYSIHSLAFDGLMLNGNYYDDMDLLNCIEKEIASKTMFKMELTYKQQEPEFSVPDDYNPIVKNSYEDVKKEFEKTNCKVGVEFVNENRNDYNVYRITDFGILHQALKYYNEDLKKSVSFLPKWYDDETKRSYEKFDCFPVDCPDYIYNTWIPFRAEILPEYNNTCENALSHFKRLVKVLCDNDEKVYEFVLKWLAQLIQYPATKSIQINFISREGCGKGTLLLFLRKMLGRDKVFEPDKPQDEVFGTNNAGMEKGYLVVFNEANKSNFYNSNDLVKKLITEPLITIKEKYMKNKIINSYHKFMLFTNNPEPAMKNKRRDLFIRCSDELIDNDEFFKEAHTYINDDECIKYIYNYLKNDVETQKVFTKNDIPRVEYDDELAEVQEPPVVMWLKSYIYTNKDSKNIQISVSELWANFHNWYVSVFDKSCDINKNSFGLKIKFLQLNSISKKVMKCNGVSTKVYNINVKEAIKELKIDIDYLDGLEEWNGD